MECAYLSSILSRFGDKFKNYYFNVNDGTKFDFKLFDFILLTKNMVLKTSIDRIKFKYSLNLSVTVNAQIKLIKFNA